MPSPVPFPTLDELDRGLIALLRQEPRQLNTALAAVLGVSEVTVAARIRALEADGAIRISAQRDFRAAGYDVLASVDLGVRGRPVIEVADEVALLEGVCMVTLVMGERPLMLLVAARSVAELYDIVSCRIAAISGVSSIESMLITQIVKYRSEFAVLSPRPAA